MGCHQHQRELVQCHRIASRTYSLYRSVHPVYFCKGAFTPTRSGSAPGGPPVGLAADEECFLQGWSVYTSADPRAVSVCRSSFSRTGSLIYKYWPISALYSCGSRRRIAPWAFSAGARRGGPAGPWWCKQHHTIHSNRFFRVGVNAP